MKKSTYNYVDRDLLTTPEKYQMTPFEGIEFLNAYKESRKKIIDMPTNDNDFNLNSNILNQIETAQNDKILSQTIFSTKELLLFIYKENTSAPDIIHRIQLDRIIKKFELKKKIYEKYDEQFHELTNEYDDVVNYALLSINCMMAYGKSHNLRYLNTSLKINDILISQIKKINNKDKIALCKFALKLELDLVTKLCQKKGINLE